MKTLKEKIEVMQAALDGADIELYSKGDWKYINYSNDDIVWDWMKYDYRIKPKPIEFWVNIYKGPPFKTLHSDITSAEFEADGENSFLRTLKVVEAE